MATILASTVINNASTVLQDTTNVRWPQLELLAWLNDGQREVVTIKPNASVVNASIPLVSGTKQSVPATAVTLIDVVRNAGGTAIRLVTREILDAQLPAWHTSTTSTTVKHYVFNPFDPKTFYVYPPSPGGNYVDIVYTSAPSDVPNTATAISIDDIYAPALTNYILYRAYSKDAEYAANAGLADAYYKAFQMQLGMKVTAEAATNPNNMMGNPGVIKGGK